MDAENNIFFEIYSGIPRVGPGDLESTRRALAMLQLPPDPRILDIGCGPGMQTVELAQATGGIITALDLNPDYLVELRKRSQETGVGERIETVLGSMFSIPFADDSFDLIWSEGAIYIIGFKEGLENWRRLLRDEAYIAVTHISWLRPSIPQEVQDYWNEEYPAGVRNIEENLQIAAEAGYSQVGHFILPESAWWGDYYMPLEQKLPGLIDKYTNDENALALISQTQREIDLFRRYNSFYGYVFYVLQKGA